jgi:hypothetical protein
VEANRDSMFRTTVRRHLITAIGFGAVLVSVIVAAELVRLFFLLRRIHGVLGYAYAGVLLVLVCGGLLYVLRNARSSRAWRWAGASLGRTPSAGRRRRVARGMVDYLERLLAVPGLDQAVLRSVQEEQEVWRRLARQRKSGISLSTLRKRLDRQVLPPVYRQLESEADAVTLAARRSSMRRALLRGGAPEGVTDLRQGMALATGVLGRVHPDLPFRSQVRWALDVYDAVEHLDWEAIEAELVGVLAAHGKGLGDVAWRLQAALLADLRVAVAGQILFCRCMAHRPWHAEEALRTIRPQVSAICRTARTALETELKPVLQSVISLSASQAAGDAAGWEQRWERIGRELPSRLASHFPETESEPADAEEFVRRGGRMSSRVGSLPDQPVVSSREAARPKKGLRRIGHLIRQRFEYDQSS